MNKTVISILKILEKHQNEVIGSREISRQLQLYGVDLTERTVRYHLRIMDERGLTTVHGKEGRQITEKGIEELRRSDVSERVGFIISKIESLSYQSNFDINTMQGQVVLNVSFFEPESIAGAMKELKNVFSSPYVMSDRVFVAHEGQSIGDVIVPEGMVGLGTLCSVTINSILLKHGIPVTSKYGGVVEVSNAGQNLRFTSLISYEGSSLDPLLVFIKSGMTSVNDTIHKGHGMILASFREIPVVCAEEARKLQEKMRSMGILGLHSIGMPNQPLFEVPVSSDKVGLMVVGGLNPIAALEELGINTQSKAMSVMMDYKELTPFAEVAKQFTAS